MLKLASEAMRSFGRAFGASLLVLLPGVLSVPNLNGAFGVSVAALIASFTAGLKALQVFVPDLTFARLVPLPYAYWVDSFVRAFLASLLVLVPGALYAPNLSTARAALTSAVVAAVTAGLRALQGVLTKGEAPAPSVGLKDVHGNPV